MTIILLQVSPRPLPVVELVSVVVRCDDVQQEDVFGLRVQSGNSELHLREHLPGTPDQQTQFDQIIAVTFIGIKYNYRIKYMVDKILIKSATTYCTQIINIEFNHLANVLKILSSID